jgi:hypothetical protein
MNDLFVSRTKVVVPGTVDAEGVSKLFEEMRGDSLVSMTIHYNEKLDRSCVMLTPIAIENQSDGYCTFKVDKSLISSSAAVNEAALIRKIWSPSAQKLAQDDVVFVPHIFERDDCYEFQLIINWARVEHIDTDGIFKKEPIDEERRYKVFEKCIDYIRKFFAKLGEKMSISRSPIPRLLDEMSMKISDLVCGDYTTSF